MTLRTRVSVRALLGLAMLLGALGGVTIMCASAAHADPATRAPASVQAAPPPTAGTLQQGCLGAEALCEAAGGLVGGVSEGLGAIKDTNDTVKDATGLDALGGLPGLPGAGIPGLPGVPGIPGVPDATDVPELLAGGFPGVGNIPNPLATLGEAAAKAAADAWTAAMLAIWSSGLFILRIVLTFSEMFLTPDLRGDGPGRDVYGFTLWLAGAMVVVLTLIQLAATVFKREAKGLGRALIGASQFVVVCACWFGYCTLIVAACGALTRALMKALLNVNTWPDWEPFGALEAETITDGTVATVLAFLGIFLWLAAIGHIIVYLARAASLLILTATGPLAASGLVAEPTRSWFWKSLRWFHAAAFTPVLMVMVLGIGVQLTSGVAAHLSDGAQKSIGTALPSVMVILVSFVAPLALFKLMAFVDPGTPSGSSFRQGMAAQGWLQGKLSGDSGGASNTGSTAASTSDENGRSGGESSAESATGDRFSKSTQGLIGSLGPVGAGLAAGMGAVTSLGARTTGLLSDETNQAGVGQNTYGPDFSSMRSNQNGQQGGLDPGRDDESDLAEDDGCGPPRPPPPPPPPPTPPGGQPGRMGAPQTPAPGGGGAGGTAGGAGVAGGAGAAVPPVP